MEFWIEKGKLEDEFKFEKSEFAEEFLCTAANLILTQVPSPEYWLINYLYIDLLRIKQNEVANSIKELQTINTNFHLTETRAITSIENSKTLLDTIPKHKDYSASIIAHRLIEEGKTNQLLERINLQEISYDAQKEILNLINRYERNLNLSLKLNNDIKKSKDYDYSLNGMNYIICDHIKENRLTFSEALNLLKEHQISNELYSSLARSSAESGNIDEYEAALNYLNDDFSRTSNIISFLNGNHQKLNRSDKAEMIGLLKKQKMNKEISVYLKLMEWANNDKPAIDSDIIEYCKKNKKYQPEDFICSLLNQQKRYKECVEFIDETNGRNRFGFYESCLFSILNSGDIDYVIRKMKDIKDNHTRAQIINMLLSIDDYEKAMSLNKELFKSKKSRTNFTNQHFIKYLVRNNMKQKAIDIINKDKNPSGSVGIYHHLGRMSMGIKYGSIG